MNIEIQAITKAFSVFPDGEVYFKASDPQVQWITWKGWLTGSHAFGTAHQESDIDFMFEYSFSLEEALKSLGFTEKPNGTYSDNLTKMVLCFHGFGLHIDVQLVNDLELKKKVQDFLIDSDNYQPDRNDWDEAIRLAETVRRYRDIF